VTDYGQELQFGVFISPDAAESQRVLELARLADTIGLDLVTTQDHPYQPRHLDTWTLLAVIAAQTAQVRVAPNVANLPLRQPVVLARSVATLDRISNGRVELGLGAGAFWDAIVAVGGKRLRPRESVEALGEAIDIIRAMWDVGGDRTALRHEGVHYRVKGAHPGPSPVHPVEIWLGAYRPRILALTGTTADGWLPSMGYSGPDALRDMNARIDEAATAAGREPASIRRLYNINGRFGTGTGFLTGTPRDWAEQLAALTLTEGMSSYILASDDAATVQRFAEEVAPAVRDLVDVERASDTAQPAAVRSTHEQTVGFAVVPTPDDGVRLSDEAPWDESERPTASAVGSDRPYTQHDQAAGQHLVDIHDALRAELDQLRDVVDQVAHGEMQAGQARSLINTMTMRQNKWTLGAFCESYCRIVTGHHTLEDRSVFPHLRRADPRLTPVLDRLQDEHEVIAGVLDRVDRALVTLVSERDGMVPLREAVDLLTDTMRSHLSYEERELVEPLSRYGYY
jgi:alkanesulfonate monooxygenase SsuD/methylene tetrahydromethanopterin reductase-like flavin-dependent oxidoreductase (luciferase family)/hemerythrin-like domain-containing protein